MMVEQKFICPTCSEAFEISVSFEAPPVMMPANQGVIDASMDEEMTTALTAGHVAALEAAIRAEGFDILVDTDTGEITLKRTERRTTDG